MPAPSAAGRAEDAYRFGRGEEVTSSTGIRVRLSQPARLPRHHGSLRQHGILRTFSPEAALLRIPRRRWYDMIQSAKA